MKIEIKYLRYCVAVILAIGLWGFLAPPAFNFSPLLGAIVIISVPIFAYWILKPVYKLKNVETNEKK